MNARLRVRRLKPKPRIITAAFPGCFWVERLRIIDTDCHRAQAHFAYSLDEALDIAHQWAGESK